MRTPATTVLAAVLLAGCGTQSAGGDAEQTERQAEVTSRGGPVMGFDQAATLHRFVKTADGGVQTVEVRDPSDSGQRQLIRTHLVDLAAAFRTGNYQDPSAIHGADMAGLATLAESSDRLEVSYRETQDGAQLDYRSENATVIAALHR